MRIAIASDHAGFDYKERIKQHLVRAGHDVRDFGTASEESVDYPDFIRPAALAVARGECERGIVLGGSGNGEAMAANRIKGVRCAVGWNAESARLARQHSDGGRLRSVADADDNAAPRAGGLPQPRERRCYLYPSKQP